MQRGQEVGENPKDESCTTELDGSQEPLEALERKTSASGTSHFMSGKVEVVQGRAEGGQPGGIIMQEIDIASILKKKRKV